MNRHAILPCLVGTFLVATALFGIDLLYVIFGGGVTVRLADFELRSTTMEFPAIALAVSGLLTLCVAGKWREAGLLITSIAFAAGFAELLFRVMDHPLAQPHVDYVAWYRPSDYYGHELVPGFEGFGPLNVPVKINNSGFRDVEHAAEKSPGAVRILGLGDSFVFGWGIPIEDTFLRRLETRLGKRINSPIETINAGVPGWGLNQYFLFLNRIGVNLSPDLVVLAYFVDDLIGPPQDTIQPSVQYALGLQYKDGVMHHSRLFNFLKSISHLVREKNRPARVSYLHDLEARRGEYSRRATYLMSESSPAETSRYTEMLEDHLARIQSVVSAAGSVLIIMYVPDISQLHHPESQVINRILHRTSLQLSIPFVDMTPIFEQSEDPGRYYLWPADPHTNGRGHEEMAATLERMICELPAWQTGCTNREERHASDRSNL